MRSSLTATKGLKLIRGPGLREDAQRRWWAAVGVVAGLAVAGSVVGYLTTPAPGGVADAGRTGPFSYFPSE